MKKIFSSNKATIIKVISKILLVTVVISAFSGCGSSSKGPDFKTIYDEYCSSIWADVGSDGSYLAIDTNPYDEDDNGIAYYAAYFSIRAKAFSYETL